MGLFKWNIRLGEYGECIADGYAYAKDLSTLEQELSWKYNNQYHRVVIEDDWQFDEEDAKDLCDLEFIEYVNTKIAIRWED